jgi:hypothetical protein
MRRLVALLSSSLLLVAACSSTHADTSVLNRTPDQQPPQADTSVNQPTSASAPKVTKPLDISHFQEAPCDTLTTGQIRQLLGTSTQPPDLQSKAVAGPACSWHVSYGTASVTAIYPDVANMGLSYYYIRRQTDFPFFVELAPVNGYPSVALGKVDDRAKGKCGIAVGASDQAAFDISISLSSDHVGKKDPCATAQDVAAMAITTFEGRQ